MTSPGSVPDSGTVGFTSCWDAKGRRSTKRVYRLYRAEGLAVRRKVRKKLNAGERVQKPTVSGPNQRWSMDFMSDQLASGQRFRVFNVVDDFTRENLVTANRG